MGVEAASVDEDGNATSSVLKITADGKDIEQVGNTMIFAETGLDEVEGYTLPRDIQTSGGTINLVDSAINDIKSKIGKSRVVVVSSQLGVPIAVYQGNSGRRRCRRRGLRPSPRAPRGPAGRCRPLPCDLLLVDIQKGSGAKRSTPLPAFEASFT